MKKTLSISKLYFGVLLSLITVSGFAQQTDEKSKQLLTALTSVNGGYEALVQKKDVQFIYSYDDKRKGLDLSTERHIFDGEYSWAEYKQHAVNVLPEQKGVAKQALINGKPSLTLDGKQITDAKALGGTVFLRKVNFFWFTMMYKLEDPGTIFKYLGTEEKNGVTYDKVSLTYDGGVTKKEADDEYILYFNPKTHLIDEFLFSLPAWGINKPILKMELTYEKIDGIYIATVRKGFMPNDKGGYDALGVYTTSDVKFNNGFTPADFEL